MKVQQLNFAKMLLKIELQISWQIVLKSDLDTDPDTIKSSSFVLCLSLEII
jgi:hypothetical protein